MPFKLINKNVKSLYLGEKEIQKVYIGTNLVYQKSPDYTDIKFTSCPFPTSWIKGSSLLEFYGDNEYGNWRISADSYNSSSYYPNKAFDNNTSTMWMSAKSKIYEEIKIELPDGIFICPNTILLSASYLSNSTNVAKIEGFINDEWETLVDNIVITTSSSNVKTYSLTTEKFYNKFRVYAYGYNSYNKRVREFQITSGIIRK